MSKLSFNVMYPGKYNYLVGSNITNFFAIGDFLKKDDFYLIGYHKSNGKIIVLGNIFASNGNLLCTINNNFELTSLNPENLLIWKTIGDDEIELIDKAGVRILYAKTSYNQKVQTTRGILATNITELTGSFYNKKGELMAQGTPERLELKAEKGVFGATKIGGLGIMLSCIQDEVNFIQQFVKDNL